MQGAREAGRNRDDELNLASGQLLAGFGSTQAGALDGEVIGESQRRDQRAGEGALVLHHHQGWQMFGIAVDGKAKQRQLQQRNADHHGEGQPIPSQLNELLADHRPEAAGAE